MNFRLTARDEFTADAAADHAGGLSVANVALTVDGTAGPFLVTSRATAGATASGAEPVTWDVANTAAVLAPNVKISLSVDGGLTFPYVVAPSTPNDGSQTVTLPDLTTSTARFKIEAVDNYFFDVNDANFSIAPAGTNEAPDVYAGPDDGVVVGGTFTSDGSFADEDLATVTATVDYGDGTGSQALALNSANGTFALSHVYAAPGVQTVTVTVTDAGLLMATDTATVTVAAPPNVAPTVGAGPDGSVTVGATFSGSGSFTDDDPGSVTATVDYGDGTGTQALPLDSSEGSFSLSHVYATPGTRTVTVTVTDAALATDDDSATVTVTAPPNLAPTVDAGAGGTVVAGGTFTSSGTFDDDVPATVTATVDYGDGSGSQSLTLNSGAKTFALSHLYAAAATRTVTVTVTDAALATATDTATVTVTAAPGTPPTAPPVTDVHLGDGKGSFASPEKSSKAVKSAKGKAKLTFTAGTKGAPYGSATLKFKKGKIAFAGSTVTTASVSGKTLTMTVTGTNSGASGFTLVIVAVDAGAKDKVRVRLLKGSKVVYDSMPGASASAAPTTKLKGQVTIA
jgi:PKD repeat protein